MIYIKIVFEYCIQFTIILKTGRVYILNTSIRQLTFWKYYKIVVLEPDSSSIKYWVYSKGPIISWLPELFLSL